MTITDLKPQGEVLRNLGVGNLYLVSHGKSGGLGCFVADFPENLPRGTMVVISSVRGLEAGEIVGPASQRHARLLGPALAGRLLRPFSAEDAGFWQAQQQRAQTIFDEARILAGQMPLEILDVDILFDGSQAILQYLGAEDVDLVPLAERLQRVFGTDIRFENLNQTPAQEEEDHHDDGGGCGKPDCGKASGGSCTSCGTGGGCSSCAKGSGVDLKDYFAHLRGKMESNQERVSLL